jgi:hypothetical protein
MVNGFLQKVWLCAIFIVAVNAHGEQKSIYYYGKYSPGTLVPLFGDNVNIRENPSLRAKVVARLPITHQVRIKEKLKDVLEIQNYRENWYRIEFRIGEKSFKGFVWGGLLAKAFIHEDISGDNEREWIVIGITGVKKGNRVAEARIVKKGRVISKPVFNPIDISASRFFDYTVSAEVLPHKSFTPPLKIIRIYFSYEACDYPNGDVLLTWNGKELRYGLTAMFSSSEFGGSSYQYIFPVDKRGKENHIIIKYTVKKIEEDSGKKSTEVSYEKYRWDGEQLKRVK